MRPITVTYSPTVSSANAIATSQTPSGAGAVTLDGALVTAGVATMGASQFITITSGSNISNRTFALVGTDFFGNALTETVTGPNNTTVASTKSFYTLTSATISGSAAGAITIGVNGAGDSRTIILDTYQMPFNLSVGALVTGTPTYRLQYTYDDVFAATWPNSSTQNWFTHSTMTGLTASADATINNPVTAIRIGITTGASPQSITLRVIQSGLGV